MEWDVKIQKIVQQESCLSWDKWMRSSRYTVEMRIKMSKGRILKKIYTGDQDRKKRASEIE